MFETCRGRLVALSLTLLLTSAALIGAGLTFPPIGEEPQPVPGEPIEVGGPIVATDPIQIEDEGQLFTIEGVTDHTDTTPTEGDQLIVYGTATDEQTIHADALIHRQPWELQYMYAVSLIAGLWVLIRFLRGWRLDRTTFGFEPRDTTDDTRGTH